MTFGELLLILDDIDCSVGGIVWTIRARLMGDGFYLQIRYMEPDIVSGIPELQSGRKWYVSSHATKSEVVQTVLKAALTSAEHIVREHFRYRGQNIFGPHFDVDALAALVASNSFSRRNNVFEIEQIAKVAHETNRAFCESIGDPSQKPWDQAEQWQRESAMKGVEFALSNPDAPAAAQHEAWLADKTADGWRYGAVKNSETKEHPCFLPYSQLPVEQRLKDYLFKAVVAAFAGCVRESAAV